VEKAEALIVIILRTTFMKLLILIIGMFLLLFLSACSPNSDAVFGNNLTYVSTEYSIYFGLSVESKEIDEVFLGGWGLPGFKKTVAGKDMTCVYWGKYNVCHLDNPYDDDEEMETHVQSLKMIELETAVDKNNTDLASAIHFAMFGRGYSYPSDGTEEEKERYMTDWQRRYDLTPYYQELIANATCKQYDRGLGYERPYIYCSSETFEFEQFDRSNYRLNIELIDNSFAIETICSLMGGGDCLNELLNLPTISEVICTDKRGYIRTKEIDANLKIQYQGKVVPLTYNNGRYSFNFPEGVNLNDYFTYFTMCEEIEGQLRYCSSIKCST
jgi:hypothetical protein